MVFKRAYCVFALAEMQSFLQLPQDEIQERYNVLGRVNIAANPKSERIVALLYCNGRSCVSALFKSAYECKVSGKAPTNELEPERVLNDRFPGGTQ